MPRLALLLGFLVACGGSSKGPTWPQSAGDGSDGGESLAPKPGSVVVSAADDDDEDIVVDKSDDKPTTKATTSDDQPSESRPTTPTITAPEDIINTDDLVIEIDD